MKRTGQEGDKSITATMKDVARLAGVSVSTVSRVINDTVPVEPETRERVLSAIRDTDFRPNLLARGLRSKSGNLIGLLVPDILNESFALMSKYAEEFAERAGFALIIGNTNNDPDKEERFIRDLVRRHVDGIIFSRVSDESRILQIIKESRIPSVIIDRSLEQEDVPTVVMDNHSAGVMAAEHLLSLGHRRFACITGPMNIAIVRERFLGFQETVNRRGASIPESCVYEGNFKYEAGSRAIEQLGRQKEKFTALWAHNDLMALGALNELQRQGKRVPEEVSLVGLDNISISKMVAPALTTIGQPFREMCGSAVDIILRIRRGEKIPQLRVTLAPELFFRGTSGTAPAVST